MIQAIPAGDGNHKLLLKEPRKEGEIQYVKYRSTYNDMPWQEIPLALVDENRNFAITGDDGTVIWRFPVMLINRLADESGN